MPRAVSMPSRARKKTTIGHSKIRAQPISVRSRNPNSRLTVSSCRNSPPRERKNSAMIGKRTR